MLMNLRTKSKTTGRYITADEASKSLETTIFEGRKNGEVKQFRPRTTRSGKLFIGKYMMLEPVDITEKKT